MFTVSDIMTTELFTLELDASLREARKLMAEHHIRHIPVVDERQHLVGLLSQRDVLAAADSTLVATPTESDSIERLVAVSSTMSIDVKTVDENASLRGVALYIQKHKIGCLPVLRGQKLVGIVTDTDFVSVAINLMEQMEQAEPEDLDFLEDVV